MHPYQALFLLSVFGALIAVYLIKHRWAESKPRCVKGKCHTVLESQYKSVLGLHVDILGLLFYTAEAIFVAAIYLQLEFAQQYVQVYYLMILWGAVFSAYLTFIQWKIIKEWCIWCLTSATTTWIMLIALVIYLF